MSLPQSKAEKNDAQLRRAAGGGRSSGAGHQHHPPKGVGGPSPHNSSNAGGKRSNGPGGQSKGNPNAGSSQSNANKVQNGGQTQRQQPGLASGTSGSHTVPATKQSNVVASKSNGILPKPPTPQPSSAKVPEQSSLGTTSAVLGESDKSTLQQPFAIHFGSFNVPLNGFQIPARTSSAPPNFDEQKRDQARSGPPIDVSVGKMMSTLSGTQQQLEGQTVSKQVASTSELPHDGSRLLQGPKVGSLVVQTQELLGGGTPSTLPSRPIQSSSSQLHSQGVASVPHPSSSQQQSYGMVPAPRVQSSHLQSQVAASGSRAQNSQLQSQGTAPEMHVPSSKLHSQGATPGLHAPSSQLHLQGFAPGLHAPSSQLQSQVVSAGLYAPSSQLQSHSVAPGSRSLQLPMQMPQVQPQLFGSQALTAGALPSQGMMHHGLSFPQPMRHMMPQQVNAHIPTNQFLQGNHQINNQIPIQISPQLGGSVGTNISSFVPTPQPNQYTPQRTSIVKITHPETHEELKFGPKGVKSDSHADSGSVKLVPDSNPLQATLPPYVPTHSSSVPISGLHQMNFYPSVSVPSYAHPQNFHQPPKTTSAVRPNIVRPFSGQNVAPVSHSGANVDVSKHPPHAVETTLAPVQVLEGKTVTSTISLSQSSYASVSAAVSAVTSVSAAVSAVTREDIGNSQSTIPVSKVSAPHKSDVGVKMSTTNMPATTMHNLSDGIVLSSSALSASRPGANYHASEEQKSESVKPVGVSTREHTKKTNKSDGKHKKQQQQPASLQRSSSNAQVELKVEAATEPTEVGGSCAEAEKLSSSQSKHKKQQQQQAPSLRSSSKAQTELKTVSTESSEVGSSCTETDKTALSQASLTSAIAPLASVPQKTVKAIDGGASPELARKAIETVLQSSCSEPCTIAHLSNSAGDPIKVEKSTSKSPSGSMSKNAEISSVGITGDEVPMDKMLRKKSSIGTSEHVQDSEAKDECVLGSVSSHMESLDQRDGERTDTSVLEDKPVVKEAGVPMKFREAENICNDTLEASRNSTSNEHISVSDSYNGDVKKLQLDSLTNSDVDQLDYGADSVIENEKARLPDEQTEFGKMKYSGMASQQAELDNGTVVDDQNFDKDKKTEESAVTMQLPSYSDEATQSELPSESPSAFPVSDVAIIKGQAALPSCDKTFDSDLSFLHTSKSGHDVGTGLAKLPTANVKMLDPQDKAEVSSSNSDSYETVAASSQVLSLPVEFEAKVDLLGAVIEKESKSSSDALSNNRTTSSGDVPKTVVNKKKKKRDYLSKADAAAPTGDLYNAYKVQEKQEDLSSVEPKVVSSVVEDEPSFQETQKQDPNEVDDWEDAAELSTNMKQVAAPITKNDSSGDKKYSRDFLLTFRDHFKDLPLQFEICPDIGELMDQRHHGEGEPASSGRIPDWQQSGNSRLDRHGSNIAGMDEDKWTKPMDTFPGGRDMRMDMGVNGPPGGFRPGQGYNAGFGRNMRGAAPNMSGILQSGTFVQTPFPQGGLIRNNSDLDRWQRASGFQKGLIPPPQVPSPAIHKTEKRYEVGRFSDDEEFKQRQIKSILNKLTPQNFDKLFLQVKEVNIDSAVCLTGVINQIFDKALTEPTFCEMYAKFCVRLAAELPEFYEDNERVMFRRVLLNKCQEEFERDEREQAENEKAEDGEIKLSKEELEEKRAATRRRMLGNIRFIGELYKESMLTERIMHECIKKLLGEYQKPDEEDVEALCKLMSTIGHMIDHPKAKEHIDAYFDRMSKMAINQVLPSRLRFMLKDVIDLRRNGWQQRRKVDGPKKIEEVHRDAAQERQQLHGGRLNRVPSMGHPGRRLSTPPDHGSRGPPMPPFMSTAPMGSAQHMSGMRGSHAQTGMRGFIAQDARISDRIAYDRTMAVPLQHRPSDDAHLTLGPQGGLGRVITGRGQPLPSNRSSLADVLPATLGSNRRASLASMSGYNPNSGAADRMSFGSRDEISARVHGAEKFPKAGIPERNALGNDRREVRNSYSFGGRGAPAEYQQEYSHGPSSVQFSEEQLTKKSDMAIKEYYSVRDMKEATLCVCDLKSTWFHPTLVSLWIMDSFDRKDVERDLLGNLFIYLLKNEPFVLSSEHLIKGLEKVAVSLEDNVVDAPKAPEFLGRILGKFVVAGILSIRDIAALLKEGGIEPGSLLETGLAVDVLGTVLDVIRRENGENVVLDLYRSSGLHLECFMPPGEKPGKFESFLEMKNIQCLSAVSINRHM